MQCLRWLLCLPPLTGIDCIFASLLLSLPLFHIDKSDWHQRHQTNREMASIAKELITCATILFTLKTCAITSVTATAIIVTTNSKTNSNELNGTNSKSVALSLTQPLIAVSEQRLAKEVLNNYPQQTPSDTTDGYYGKCFDDVSHGITPSHKQEYPCLSAVTVSPVSTH